ncbi:hypothetical protein NKH72_32140 [Mesorhizobium sp. M0955]|uniref:hypothetical protein n=1 Tax=Mesorhizobium sp. M0955 TaxID=2957033 RepID=UPI0033354232
MLKIIAAIDVLLAQEKEIVIERFVVNKNVARFSDWFDTFVEVETDHLDSLVQLLSATTAGDSQSREAALEALKLAKVQQEKDIKEARGYLKSALSSAKSNSVARAMVTLSNIRNQLVLLLEGRRGKLRELVDSMAAEDRARRVLCAPPYVLTVACKEIHTECRYYSADPASPLPCGDLVYLNMFPIEAIQQIYNNLETYAQKCGFICQIGVITSTKPISESAYRSPEEIFGDELLPSHLLPKEFLIQQGWAMLLTIRSVFLRRSTTSASLNLPKTETKQLERR